MIEDKSQMTKSPWEGDTSAIFSMSPFWTLDFKGRVCGCSYFVHTSVVAHSRSSVNIRLMVCALLHHTHHDYKHSSLLFRHHKHPQQHGGLVSTNTLFFSFLFSNWIFSFIYQSTFLTSSFSGFVTQPMTSRNLNWNLVSGPLSVLHSFHPISSFSMNFHWTEKCS